MNKSKTILLVTIVFFLASAVSVNAITIEQAVEKLKTHQFGQNQEVLDFLYETAVASHSDPALRKKLNDGLSEVLQSEASYDAKQFACRQLALTATTEQIPVLAKHLGDEKMSHIALYALVHINDDDVDRALVEALGKSEGATLKGIITAVGNRKSKIAVGELSGLVDSNQKKIAEAAALALGRIGTKEAADILKEHFSKIQGALPGTSADALLTCADNIAAGGDTETALKIYEMMFQVDQLSSSRCAALMGIGRNAGQDAVSFVRKGLQDQDRHVRNCAAQVAQQISGKDVTIQLARCLPSIGNKAKILLINALAVRQDRAALEAVLKIADSDGSVDVRVAAVNALKMLGDKSCVGFLAERAAQTNPIESAPARQVLESLPGEDINNEIVSLIKRSKPEVQIELINALAKRNATETSPAILKMTGSKNSDVRKASVRALGDLATVDLLSPMVGIFTSAEPDEINEIAKAIASTARRCSAEKSVTAILLEKLDDEKNIRQRAGILRLLGDLGRDEALAVLRAALEDEDQAARDAAIRSLSGWSNSEPMDDLLKVVETSDNKIHRVLALRGYINLIGLAGNLSSNQKLDACKKAMAVAEGTGERKKTLAALAGIATLDALNIAEKYLADSQLKNDAALAAITIGEKLFSKHPVEINASMEKVIDAQIPEFLDEKAQKVIEEIEMFKDYLSDWQVEGPYLQEGKEYKDLFDIKFGPEIPEEKVQWKQMPVSSLNPHPAYLDLLKELNGGNQRVAYLRTTIDSAQETISRLEIFSDDGVKAWLNGHVVHSNNTARPIMPDPDVVSVKLNKGANTLMLKITQNNMPWGAVVRRRYPKVPKPKLGEGFKLHTINTESKFEAAGIGDFNRDGKLDIFSGRFWYEAPTWKQHFVREVQYDGNYYHDFADIPFDVDGDGWVDVVSAAYHNKKLFWVRNPGKTGKWEVFDVDEPGHMETAFEVDINGDGQLDILPNIMSAVAWYEFRPDASAKNGVKWTRHDLPKEAVGHGVGAGDINGDGRCDIVGPKGWLEQGANSVEQWKWHAEFSLGAASIPILVHDPDNDGDGDIICGNGHNYGLYWLEQSKDTGGKRTWTKHDIDYSWSQPHFMLMVDLDNDGKAELVTGKRKYAHNGHDPGGNDPLCVYYYSFDVASKKWTRHLLHENGNVGFGIYTQVKDIDSDGDLDIVAPGKSGLYLFENLLK